MHRYTHTHARTRTHARTHTHAHARRIHTHSTTSDVLNRSGEFVGVGAGGWSRVAHCAEPWNLQNIFAPKYLPSTSAHSRPAIRMRCRYSPGLTGSDRSNWIEKCARPGKYDRLRAQAGGTFFAQIGAHTPSSRGLAAGRSVGLIDSRIRITSRISGSTITGFPGRSSRPAGASARASAVSCTFSTSGSACSLNEMQVELRRGGASPSNRTRTRPASACGLSGA